MITCFDIGTSQPSEILDMLDNRREEVTDHTMTCSVCRQTIVDFVRRVSESKTPRLMTEKQTTD